MFKLEIENKEYTFEVHRRSIKKAEENGITLGGTGFGATYDMFYIGLVKHQPKISVNKAYDLYDALVDEGEYNPSEVMELIAKEFEDAFKKLDNPNPKKKIIRG